MMDFSAIMKNNRFIKKLDPENPLLKPIPVLGLMSLFLIGIYVLISFFPFLYDVLEQSRTNPASIFTSLFIHNLDNLDHLLINLIGLWIFGYIVAVQIGHTKLIGIFLLCGVSANIASDIFGNLINSIVTPRFIAWAVSSGFHTGENLQIFPSPSGGGASGALTGLVGFAIAISLKFFIDNNSDAFKNRNSESGYLFNLRKNFTSSFSITMIQTIALLGAYVIYLSLIVDLEMFTYILTNNYAAANGAFLPFPTSRGHSLLAHVFGGLIGFIFGVYYNPRLCKSVDTRPLMNDP